MGGIDLVLVMGIIGFPFYAGIVGLSEVVEGAQGWLIFFKLNILAQG